MRSRDMQKIRWRDEIEALPRAGWSTLVTDKNGKYWERPLSG